MKMKTVHIAIGSAFTLSSAAWSPATYAQSEGKNEPARIERVEKVEVTGSRIKRAIEDEGATAVEIITREDIDRRGASSVAEVVRDLTAQAGVSYDERNASVANGAASAALRGLAPNATLVLINGRRVAYNGFSSVFGLTSETFVDLNSLPLGAVDRIEILKDSASAIYGSDAIAGVINIILRKNFPGVEISARAGFARDGANEQQASLTAGLGSANSKDKLNALITFDASKREALFARDRDYALAFGRQLAGSVTTAALQSFPANALGFAQPINNTANCPSGPTIGPSASTAGSTLCGFNSNSQATLVPNQERQQVFGRISYDFDSQLTFFGEAGLSKTKTQYDLVSTGFTIAQLPATSPANPFGQPIRAFYRFVELGPRKFSAENESLRLIAGLKGRLADHEWEIAAGQATTQSEQRADNLVKRSEWLALVNSGGFNLFGGNSASVYDALRASASREGEAKTRFIDAKMTGELPWSLAGPISYAIGGEFRRESQSDSPSAILQSGSLLGFATTNLPFTASRNVTSAFAELNMPIVKSLEAQLALRSERYSDFGASTNPKFGLRFQPWSQLVLRASGGTSFRAPSLLEANYPQSSAAGGVTDSTRCIAQGIAFSSCPLSLVDLRLASSSNIGPETAKNYTLGAVFAPNKQVSIAVDFVDIRYKNKIGLNLAQVFPSNGGPIDERFVTRGAPAPGDAPGVPPPLTTVTLVFDNVFGESRYRGIDFALNARTAFASGNVSAELTGTYLDSFRQSTSQGGALATLTGGYSYPRLKGALSLAYARATWVGTLRFNHIGGYRDDVNNVGITTRVGVDSTVDAQLEYTGFKNMKLAIGARNLFDNEPPFSSQFAAGFNITLSSPRGRFVYLKGAYSF
jgi:iron complex outermembrane recepter protein